MNFSKLDAFMERLPECGIPGCELAITHHRRTVYRKCVGFSNTEKTKPVTPQDIYWIFSCTKVITCATTMRLVEEGKLSLDDPVSRYLPEFADMMVIDRKTGKVTPAENEMKIEHLFSMSSGMNYDIATVPLLRARKKEGATTRDIVRAMAESPLEFEPGTRYRYSLSHDVLAAVLEVVSGMRYSEYLSRYVLEPLGMTDIGFRPDEAQRARFSQLYRYSNGLSRSTPIEIVNNYRLSPDYDSGGAGLFSTVDSYMKFITALANGGKGEDGYSLLKPQTIRMLQENHLCDRAREDFVNARLYGYGWGLCGRVHMNPTVSGSLAPAGEFGWDGAAGAFAMVDPENEVAMYYGQHLHSCQYAYHYIHPTHRNLAYEALFS